MVDPDPSPDYRQELAAAREKTGANESVLTAKGLIRGRRVAVIVSEFRFLAGSIGLAAAERIVNTVERATREGLPSWRSGVGRHPQQEGTIAFLSMMKTSAAVRRPTCLPYLVHRPHPTTGGVMPSWGSLRHITVAEPGVLLGLLGPRVYEAPPTELLTVEATQDVRSSHNKLVLDHRCHRCRLDREDYTPI